MTITMSARAIQKLNADKQAGKDVTIPSEITVIPSRRAKYDYGIKRMERPDTITLQDIDFGNDVSLILKSNHVTLNNVNAGSIKQKSRSGLSKYFFGESPSASMNVFGGNIDDIVTDARSLKVEDCSVENIHTNNLGHVILKDNPNLTRLYSKNSDMLQSINVVNSPKFVPTSEQTQVAQEKLEVEVAHYNKYQEFNTIFGSKLPTLSIQS